MDRSKTTGQMKVRLVERRPRRPVWVGGLVSTFVKIGTPFLPPCRTKGADPLFQHRKRNAELQIPSGRVHDLRLDPHRHRMANGDLFAVDFWQTRKVAEPAGYPRRVDDVETKHRAATIELKVKISLTDLGL